MNNTYKHLGLLIAEALNLLEYAGSRRGPGGSRVPREPAAGSASHLYGGKKPKKPKPEEPKPEKPKEPKK